MISFTRPLGRRAYAFAHDSFVALLSFALALYLRLGDDIVTHSTFSVMAGAALLYTLCCVAVFLASGLYRGIWAFASVRDMMEICRASTLAVILYTIVGFVVTRLEGVPRTVPVIAWLLLMAGLGGSRMAFRLWRERRISALWERSGGCRMNVLLVGAGDETDLFIRAVSANPQSPYRIVGVVAENDKRVGRSLNGVEVLGTIDDLPQIVEKLKDRDRGPSRLILMRSLARMNGALVSKLLEQAPALGLSLSRLPALTELRNDVGSGAVKDQPIALEDLLGRPEIILNHDEIEKLAADRAVLITGAGGSIGSELTRQIAALAPRRLILLEISEFNLYKIEMEIRNAHPDLSLRGVIADVRDQPRLLQIFREEKPELIFHAAAIKHVPIAEFNAREAMMTNVVGTRNVADCAAKTGSVAMVQISTDKAVNATSVMGATKRLAEIYCQALDLASPSTRFVTVRFGNVLGSTGSVVPLFQSQLSKGGPLTVTHPDITRYFMTIREAVELVLQASAYSVRPGDQRGKILVLDMGQPVRILDLARQVIRLAGLRPDEDIKIEFTGLRPGEKLFEELFSEAEQLVPSGVDGVRIANSRTAELDQLQHKLNNLAIQLQAGMGEPSAIQHLSELVPDFNHQPNG
jgi:O-antigen biosynthesis protein WbqV